MQDQERCPMMWMENSAARCANTNLGGFSMLRVFAQKHAGKKYGRIVNVVSLSGLKGCRPGTIYAAGIIGATKALAQEIGKKNVTVNAVAPALSDRRPKSE
jgi:3-oxoacyl-[acyl-carrier protein] reductase